MHILSTRNRSEFLACPQLIRFEYVQCGDEFEPTLLIKASTLLLKYIVLGTPLQIAFSMHGDRLLYALKVFDDEDDGGVIWSIAERNEELNALRALAKGQPVQTFLFNEVAANVAWNEFQFDSISPLLTQWINRTATGQIDQSQIKSELSDALQLIHERSRSDDKILFTNIEKSVDWKPVHNTFITSHASNSLIDLYDQDEGGQQEQIAIWLTDNLDPMGVYHSPQIPKGSGTRELTDILLSHEYGAILIESKTLSVLTRDQLPNRKKLAHGINGHIKKAFRQLRGGVKKINSGMEVRSAKGDLIDVNRTHPAHAIVLIPDLELIEDRQAFGRDFISEFVKASGAIPHLLDISELLRVVQAAELIAAQGKTTTPMMAFDFYLMERVETAMKSGTLCVEILLRLKDSANY